METTGLIPNVYNESDTLSEVVLGFAGNLGKNKVPGFHPKPINYVAQQTEESGHVQDKDKTCAELEAFSAALTANGVAVHRPEALPLASGNYNQVYPRDIGFVLGDKFVVSSMRRRNRMNEWFGIKDLVDRIPEDHLIWAPDDVYIEGGDVCVDKDNVYVGIGQRTNYDGFRFIAKHVIELGMNPVPVPLVPLIKKIKKKTGRDETIDVLHLDCAFVPVGEDSALIFEAGMEYVPKQMRDDYRLIPVKHKEQQKLATNMFALNPATVITRKKAKRVNEQLANHGLDLIEVSFDEIPKYGGSFRCSTLPLVRVAK